MTIGEKVRTLRKKKKMTQAHLAAGCVSRNMLSLLEMDKVQPSLDTLRHIAKTLSVPVGYFLDDDEDFFFYQKKQSIEKIHGLFKGRKYKSCLAEIKKLSRTDDELAYIAAVCTTKLGVSATQNGNLQQACALFDEAEDFSKHTAYDTEAMKILSLLYRPVAENVQAPLFGFDKESYNTLCKEATQADFYHYLMQDTEYTYKEGRYADHAAAKQLIREKRYADAVQVLQRIEDTLSDGPYDAYLFFGIYTDLELCYKELYDFEKAYRYVGKRMSLLASFRS